ncbi:MAG: LysR family transcriptional regulator [Pseudomonadota bacterium]
MSETNWDDLRLFLAVARQSGLAGAARVTGSSAPTLGRRMLALEARLGAALFERHARGYALTSEGEKLLARAERAEAEIAPLLASERPPLIKVSAGAWMTWLLCRHTERFPSTARLRFIAAEHKLDIARREAVIGIRNARPVEVGLAARRVGQVRFAVYGPRRAPWAAVQGPTPSAAWVGAQDGPTIEVSHPRTALDLAQAGAARAVLPTFVGDAHPDLRRGKTIEALTHDQWLVSHHEARHDAEVRKLLRAVGQLLKEAGGAPPSQT